MSKLQPKRSNYLIMYHLIPYFIKTPIGKKKKNKANF